MAKRRKNEIVQVNLRLREDLRLQLLKVAEQSGRSFNQELVHRLDQSFGRVPADKVLGLAQAMLQQALDLHGQAGKRKGTAAKFAQQGPLLLSEELMDAWIRDVEEGKELEQAKERKK